MKVQKYGTPKVEFSWFLKEDVYTRDHLKVTLDSAEGKEQLVNAIKLCIDQGYEIRIGTDGECLMLEANYADDETSDASYQYVDDEHEVIPIEYLKDLDIYNVKPDNIKEENNLEELNIPIEPKDYQE